MQHNARTKTCFTSRYLWIMKKKESWLYIWPSEVKPKKKYHTQQPKYIRQRPKYAGVCFDKLITKSDTIIRQIVFPMKFVPNVE